MTRDRSRIPTGDEFDKSAPPAKKGWLLRLFKREAKFKLKPGVGESKNVAALPGEAAIRVTLPEPASKALPSTPSTAHSQDLFGPIPSEPQTVGPPPVRRIRVPKQISKERGGLLREAPNSEAEEDKEVEWKPKWPKGLTMKEMHERIGPPRKYDDPT